MDFREELSGEELATLEQYGRKVRSTAGECISIDLPREVLFIVSGSVRAKAIDACGKSVMRMYTTGEILNELSVLTAQVSLSSVTAQAPSESLLVSQSAIDALVTESPKLAAKLFRHFAKLVIYRMVPVHAMHPSQAVSRLHASLSHAC